MEITMDRVLLLLTNEKLVEIEKNISNKKGCAIYKDDLLLLASFLKEELVQSELSIEQIEHFIGNNSEVIIDFAINLLDKESPISLSTGIAVSYSIYIIYLKEKGTELLRNYIKRRRILNPNQFLEKLITIKLKMNL
ncbi:MAG: hypothetical protein H7320_21800 [Ferruginibacter sp.]|nr:hypothetical protein [Ferruginibacter sp.]